MSMIPKPQKSKLRGVVVCFWDSDAEVAGSNAGFSGGRFTTARSLEALDLFHC